MASLQLILNSIAGKKHQHLGASLRDTETERKTLKDLGPKISLWLQPFLPRCVFYGQRGSDTTSVTPGYENITECKPHVCQDQLNHTWVTSSEVSSSQLWQPLLI